MEVDQWHLMARLMGFGVEDDDDDGGWRACGDDNVAVFSAAPYHPLACKRKLNWAIAQKIIVSQIATMLLRSHRERVSRG